jgi:hypothetical protein
VACDFKRSTDARIDANDLSCWNWSSTGGAFGDRLAARTFLAGIERSGLLSNKGDGHNHIWASGDFWRIDFG